MTRSVALLAVLLGLGLGSGCVSKSKAEAKARAAFWAGQQQAAQQLAARGPFVTFVGEVRNPQIPWTADLTLAKALVAAEYFGARDPSEILLVRGGEEMRIDPSKLLEGEDIPLQPRDVIELKQ